MGAFKLHLCFLIIVCFRKICSSTIIEDYDLKKIEKLGDSYDKFLKLRSVPDVMYMKQYPPYSYHSDLFPESNFINTSEILETDEQDVTKCSDDIVEVLFNLKSIWALKMLDSEGKLTGGVLQGGLLWTGKYDECTNVYAPIDLQNHGNFHGQYCVTSWTLTLPGKGPLPLTIGICVPDSCSAHQIENSQRNILKAIGKLSVLEKFSSLVNLTSVTCKEKSKHLDGAAIAYLSIISVFGVLMLFGSLITVFRYIRPPNDDDNTEDSSRPVVSLEHPSVEEERPEPSITEKNGTLEKSHSTDTHDINDKTLLADGLEKGMLFNKTSSSFSKSGLINVLKEILLCFCIFTNGAKILNTDARSDQMLYINGIRFLSLTWVIMGHSYISAVSMISNPLDVLPQLDNWAFQAVLQAPFSVDSFFLLSGFLLTVLFLKSISAKKGKVNWIYFYVHRYWRLTPAYIVSVAFYMLLFKYLGSGPFWDDHYGDSCRHTWWMYLLYINNFIPIHDMCIGWSWYLANDMQFYIISPIFLYALWRWPKIGLGIVTSILFGSWITTYILSAKYDLIPMFVGVTKATDYTAYENKMWYSFDLIYDKPYCRIGPYMIGVILGYILFKVNDRKSFMKVWQQTIGWIIALFCSLSVVYGLYHADLSTFSGNLYNAMCRSSFSIGLAWIIFVCNTGHGGFINKILSHKIWIPLSRLTYCAYLFHPILIHGYYQALQAPLHFTHLTMVTNFLGFLTIAYGIAFLTSVAFESPMMNLEKLLIGKHS